jgi:hypothetical protein
MMPQARRKNQSSSVALSLFRFNLLNSLEASQEIFSLSVALTKKEKGAITSCRVSTSP